MKLLLAMKPVESYTQNVVNHSQAGLNIDATRVGTEIRTDTIIERGFGKNFMDDNWKPSGKQYSKAVTGRFPANLIAHPEHSLPPFFFQIGEKREENDH